MDGRPPILFGLFDAPMTATDAGFIAADRKSASMSRAE